MESEIAYHPRGFFSCQILSHESSAADESSPDFQAIIVISISCMNLALGFLKFHDTWKLHRWGRKPVGIPTAMCHKAFGIWSRRWCWHGQTTVGWRSEMVLSRWVLQLTNYQWARVDGCGEIRHEKNISCFQGLWTVRRLVQAGLISARWSSGFPQHRVSKEMSRKISEDCRDLPENSPRN